MRNDKKYHCISILRAIFFPFAGISICFLKFHFLELEYGTAQWLKYGIIFAGGFMLLAEGRLLIHSILESRESMHYID